MLIPQRVLVNPFPFGLLTPKCTADICSLSVPFLPAAHTAGPRRSTQRSGCSLARAGASAQAHVWSVGFQCSQRAATGSKHLPVLGIVPAAKHLSDVGGIGNKRAWWDPVAAKTQGPDMPPAACRWAANWTANTVDSLFRKWVCQAEVVGKDGYQHHHERSGGSFSMHSLWLKLI